MLKQLRQSLITRLMMYFVLTGLIFTLLFGINFAHSLRVHFKQEILPNIAQYLRYIVRDIGVPPDLSKAQQLTDGLSFELTILGPKLEWHSNDSNTLMHRLEFEAGPEPYQEFQIAHKRGTNVVLLKVEGYDFMFVIGRLFEGPRYERNIVFMLFVLACLALLFYLIRRSLNPLKEISRGIVQIAQGEMEKPIAVQGSMEFKNLAHGINAMTMQIKSMLESKRALLLAISHELRSPLTRAKVNLELLSDQPIKQALVDDVNEMQDLVTRILESERLNHKHAVLNKIEFSLDGLVNDVVADFFSGNAVNIESENVTICADQTRLEILVKNLIDNAIKYSREQPGKPPTIRVYKTRDDAVLEIVDYGCGMEPSQVGHITEAFYRIDQARQRNTGGVGLGLYLCLLIVTAHAGKMTFQSSLNEGTKVHVVLPLGKN